MTNSLEDQLEQLIRDYSQLVDSPFNPGEEIRILRGRPTEEGIDSGFIPDLKALILQREARARKEVIDLINQLPQGHTPDGKSHWYTVGDVEKALAELERRHDG